MLGWLSAALVFLVSWLLSLFDLCQSKIQSRFYINYTETKIHSYKDYFLIDVNNTSSFISCPQSSVSAHAQLAIASARVILM